MSVLRLLSRLIGVLGRALGSGASRQLLRLHAYYAAWTDAELLRELNEIRAGRGGMRQSGAFRSWLRSHRSDASLHALAIARVLFERHPCDLRPGSGLYDEQVEAAVILCQGSNVQMATGEGKTYVCAVAAVGMLASQDSVLIVTANHYLARRDQQRTATFFEAAGVATRVGLPDGEFTGVAYATLSDLAFGYLHRTYRPPDVAQPSYPIGAAVILDEMDSILLDQSDEFHITRLLPSSEQLWARVFSVVDQMDGDDFELDPVGDQVILRGPAWDRANETAAAAGVPVALMIDLVTAAVWARQAVEGKHYTVQDSQIRLINRVTGEEYESATTHVQALDFALFGREAKLPMTTSRIKSVTLLKRHPHVVGLSGTLEDDAIHYWLLLGTLTATIPPRFERRGTVATMLSPSRASTLEYIARHINAHPERPALIGAWSPSEAFSAATALKAHLPERDVEVVSKFDSDLCVGAFDRAGRPGAITVMSQGGSRGIDVRSEHHPMLFVLGRAVEPRLDRQFLGRVGRHGEPFEAQFIADPSNVLFVPAMKFAADMVGHVFPMQGTAARALRKLQRDAWRYRSLRRQQATLLELKLAEVEARTAELFVALHDRNDDQALLSLIDEITAPARALSGVSAERSAAEIRAALRRRAESDAVVAEFERAVGWVVNAGTESVYRAKTFGSNDDSEIRGLTRWLAAEAADTDRSGPVEQMVHTQVRLAAGQRLPAPTSPHWRSGARIVFETLILSNAALIQQIDRRLDALAVTSDRNAYHRRSAFAVRSLYGLRRLDLANDLTQHLRSVDEPRSLDHLFFSADNALGGTPPPVEAADLSASQRSSATPPAILDVRSDVESFLDSVSTLELFDIAPPAARALLFGFAKQVHALRGASSHSARVDVGRVYDLTIDSLASRGVAGNELRGHEQLLRSYLDHVNRVHGASILVPRRTSASSRLRRTARFIRTVPAVATLPLGVIGVLFVGAWLVTSPHATNSSSWWAPLSFGDIGVGRPIIQYLGLICLVASLAYALRLDHAQTASAASIPVLVLLTATWSGQPIAGRLLTASACLLAALVLLTAYRYLHTLIGLDVIAAVGLLSVGCFVATDQRATGAAAPLVLGLAVALWPGAAVPVTVASRVLTGGRVEYHAETTVLRVPIDAFGTVTVAAALPPLVLLLDGRLGVVVLAVTQVILFGYLARRSLARTRVTDTLARREVGFADDPGALAKRLSAVQLSSTAGYAALVAAAAAVALITADDPSPVGFLVAQVAGWTVARAFRGIRGVVSPTPSGASTADSENDEKLLNLIVGRVRAWTKRRYGRMLKVVLAVAMLARPLQWIADVSGMAEAATKLWQLLT